MAVRRRATVPPPPEQHGEHPDTGGDAEPHAGHQRSPSDVDDSDAAESDVDASDAAESAGDGGREDLEQQISHLSFGALKQAQDALLRKRKRGPATTSDQDHKLQALRDRLRQIRERKAATGMRRQKPKPGRPHDAAHRDPDRDDDAQSPSPPSEADAPHSRTSKHAPTAQSTKVQVSRKRQVVDVPTRLARDPRFDAAPHHPTSSAPGRRGEKAYGFLRDYQQSEIRELKAAAKTTANPHDRDALTRRADSMENRLRARDARAREHDIRRRHRQLESERVRQGKTPFFLKRNVVRERALVDKFHRLKTKDREKLLERRRRKEEQKEKRRMPHARRMRPV